MEPLMAVRGVDPATARAEIAGGGAGAQSLAADAELVLSFTDNAKVTLHVVTPHGNRVLGAFDNARDAWAAVDRIDLVP